MDEIKKLQETIEKYMAKVEAAEKARDEAISQAESKSTEKTAAVEKRASELDEGIKALKTAIEEMKVRLEDMEMKSKAPGAAAIEVKELTLGDLVVNSKQYEAHKNFKDKNSGFDCEMTVDQKDFTVTNMTVFLDPYQQRRTAVTEAPREPNSITAVTGSQTWSGPGDRVYWVEKDAYYPLAIKLTIAAASGDSTLTVSNTSGLRDGMSLSLRESGYTTRTVTVGTGGINEATKVVTLTGTVGGSHTFSIADTTITSDKFAATKEGAVKPKMTMTFAQHYDDLKKFAVTARISSELWSDAPSLRNFLNTDMVADIQESVDYSQLYGVLAANDIQGFANATGIQTRNWSSGTAGDTVYDAVIRAIHDVRIARYNPTALLINPQDMVRFDTLKDDNGQYIVRSENGMNTLYGVPVFEHSAVTAGTIVVGDFRPANVEFMVKGVPSVKAGSNGDDFIENMVTLIAEMRCVQLIKRPRAICVLTLDSAPVAST